MLLGIKAHKEFVCMGLHFVTWVYARVKLIYMYTHTHTDTHTHRKRKIKKGQGDSHRHTHTPIYLPAHINRQSYYLGAFTADMDIARGS